MTNNLPSPKRPFEFNLEALRGFAALIVVFFHTLICPLSLDPAFSPGEAWQRVLPGHSSVLLFFILSGYVIGLTNTQPLRLDTIPKYFKKRFIRLYPIYFICLIFSLLVASRPYSANIIAGHFLFLQNAVVPVIKENTPLWSLNSEVLYYIAFVPISFFNLKPLRVIIITLIAGLIFRVFILSPLLSSYCFGFVFWLSGLWLAKSTKFLRQPASPWLLAALGVIFLGYGYLNPFVSVIAAIDAKLHIDFPRYFVGITFGDLFELPFCFLLLLHFTNYTVKKFNYIIAGLLAMCYAYYFHIIRKFGLYSLESLYFLTPISFVTIGSMLLLLSRFRPQPTTTIQLPATFLKLGAISYGLYVIHFPISILLSHVHYFSGSAYTFLIRLAVDFVLVVIAAYVLELKIQPWFKKI